MLYKGIDLYTKLNTQQHIICPLPKMKCKTESRKQNFKEPVSSESKWKDGYKMEGHKKMCL